MCFLIVYIVCWPCVEEGSALNKQCPMLANQWTMVAECNDKTLFIFTRSDWLDPVSNPTSSHVTQQGWEQKSFQSICVIPHPPNEYAMHPSASPSAPEIFVASSTHPIQSPSRHTDATCTQYMLCAIWHITCYNHTHVLLISAIKLRPWSRQKRRWRSTRRPGMLSASTGGVYVWLWVCMHAFDT